MDRDDLVHRTRPRLSAPLLAIYDLELALGNHQIRLDEQPFTRLALAVVFAEPLHRHEIESRLEAPALLTWHQNPDQHYEAKGMAGYLDEAASIYIYGPIPGDECE